MKSYQKKIIVGLILVATGIALACNAYGVCNPMKKAIGDWAVVPFFMFLVLSVVQMVFGVKYIHNVLTQEKIGDQTVGEVISDKIFDYLLPVMKLIDRFNAWLDTDGSKK